MFGNIVQQGSFVSTGSNVTLNLVSGADYIETINYTQIAANAASTGYAFFALTGTTGVAGGLANGSAIEIQSNAGATAVDYRVTTTGFLLGVNSATATPGNPVALTAISNAAVPIVSTATTTGLASGSVVELINVTGGQQFGGMTFTVDTIVASTSFRLKYAPQIAAATTGTYRIIPFDPIFYPRRRFITAITTGTTTVVKMSVDHTFTVGQLVRLNVPTAYGSISTNIDGLTGTIIAIDTVNNTITLNLDSTGFGTFVFPLTTAVPFTQAQVVPVGSGVLNEETTLDDATENRAITGVVLAGGTADSPAGVANDVIYWRAYKSYSS
jgi:hypothetical protein